MLTEAVAGGFCAAAGVLAYAVRAPSSTILAPSICRGPTDRPAIALTFDDGPSESTPSLLDLLERHGTPATFFQCGANVRRLPSVARSVAEAGHEIGNHTDSHPRLDFRSRSFIQREMVQAQHTITETTGAAPRLFRAPYGVRWFGVGAAQRELNLLGVMWTVLGMDWKWPPGRITERVLRGSANGAIVCLHDGRVLERAPDVSATLESVGRILPALLEKGFQFRTVSQLLCQTT